MFHEQKTVEFKIEYIFHTCNKHHQKTLARWICFYWPERHQLYIFPCKSVRNGFAQDIEPSLIHRRSSDNISSSSDISICPTQRILHCIHNSIRQTHSTESSQYTPWSGSTTLLQHCMKWSLVILYPLMSEISNRWTPPATPWKDDKFLQIHSDCTPHWSHLTRA